ncbi:MAG: hypothetical protein OXI56_09040 [bacterium]|nr:hypothetical protein [bacterium]MDE0601923.1 hypothetical protein [bacterium]
MKRHPFNLLSLMFGIFLILLAAWTTWFVFPIRAWVIDFSRWLVPAAAILVGAALLSPVFIPRQRDDAPGDETGDEASELVAETPADRP